MRLKSTCISLTLLCITMLHPLIGCESVPALRESKAWHGETPIYATYRFGQLKAELPPGTDLETVNAVSRAVLYRQGLVIEEASFTPSDGRIIALGSGELPYKKVRVSTLYDGGGVVMTINIDPSTESRTRALFESILKALDL